MAWMTSPSSTSTTTSPAATTDFEGAAPRNVNSPKSSPGQSVWIGGACGAAVSTTDAVTRFPAPAAPAAHPLPAAARRSPRRCGRASPARRGRRVLLGSSRHDKPVPLDTRGRSSLPPARRYRAPWTRCATRKWRRERTTSLNKCFRLDWPVEATNSRGGGRSRRTRRGTPGMYLRDARVALAIVVPEGTPSAASRTCREGSCMPPGPDSG